jgi:RHS repeat-associated protein
VGIVAILIWCAGLAPSVAAVSPPPPTPIPSSGAGKLPVGPTISGPSVAITLPSTGTIIAEALPSAEGSVVANFGSDNTQQQLIADAGHRPGAFQVVGEFLTGTVLVFYITTTFNNTTYHSDGDHARVVQDGPNAWNIGWEDYIDNDYDDVITRICYQATGTTGCALPADSSFGPHPIDPHGTRSYVAYQAEPVNTETGNYTTQVTDLRYPGRGLPFTFARTYNSLSTISGDLGLGWTASIAAHLELLPGGVIAYLAGSGARFTYVPDGSGGFRRPPGQRATLSTAGGGYDLLESDQSRSHFDASGALQTQIDRNGNTITLTYSSGHVSQITDTVGRIIAFTYLPDGHLSGLSGPQGLSVAYTYDPSGHLATVQDVRGFVTNYTYDPNGRLATIVDPNSHTLVTNTYGTDGRVIEQVDARGNHTTFAWDAATETSTMTDARTGQWVEDYAGGILVSQRDPLGNLTQHGFNADLLASTVIDARGYQIDSVYDAAGNLTTHVFYNPLYAVERYTYSATNDLLTSQDRNGRTTTRTYDTTGNLKTVTGPPPISPLTTYNYDPAGTGLLFSVVDPRGKTTTFGYDPQGNRTSVLTPMGFRSTMTYDAAGRMLTSVDPRGNVVGGDPLQYTTTFAYDGAGHILTVADPLTHTTTTTYDPAGNRLTVTDANNHTTTYGYDAANELTSVQDPRLKVTSYTYDVVDNQVTRTDANMHTTTYAYDLAKRRISETRSLGRLWTYQYDPNGNLTTVIDAIGNSTPQTGDGTTTRTYDNYNRVTGITYSDATPAVTYSYDLNGNRTQMTDGVTTTYTYDELNRMTVVIRSPSFRMDYSYDGNGNVLSRIPSGGSAVLYTYDDDGRMATALSAGQATTYGHDAAANLTTTTLPSGNGYIESRTYDRAGRLTEVKNQKVATVLSKSTYTLDPVGNRSTIVSTTGTTTLTYDADDRLTQACYTTACTGSDNFRRYTYDDVGNRLTEVSAAGTTTSTYDALDQLVSSSGVGGNVTYTFNLDGDQTAAGSQTFTYDLAQRLKTQITGSTTTTYSYDGDGRRVLASTGSQANKNTKFTWDTNRALPQVVRELDGNNALVREYRYGLDLVSMTSGGGIYYYHHDGLGSVTNLSSSTGVAQWTYEYHPYGVARTTTKNNNQAPANMIQFAGEYLDPTGLYHMRARQYAPSTGRFLSTDPGARAAGRPFVSAYAFGNNNPVRFLDPSGWESTSAPTWGNVSSDCLGVSAEVGLMGGVRACNTSGHVQIQLSVGASSGVGGAIGYTRVETDASNPSQLAGFGGSFGGSAGGGLVGGGDRGYATSGRTINSISASGGIGLEVSPEFATPGEIHAEGSFTVDFNDLLHSIFGF